MIRRDKWEVVEGSDGFSSEELKEDAEKSYRQGWGEVGKWSRGYWLGAPLMIDSPPPLPTMTLGIMNPFLTLLNLFPD